AGMESRRPSSFFGPGPPAISVRPPDPTAPQPDRTTGGTAMFAELLTDSPTRETWWDQAVCADGTGDLTALFFSEELQDIAAAKRICAGCPVMAECLEGALDRREPWGVWGGQLIANGRVLANKRRRGRPPKVPRPEDHIPQIPLPERLRERVGAA
ncbi:MAG: WhiB family transcriptional regulator, partial [Actinomycetota bacterium]